LAKLEFQESIMKAVVFKGAGQALALEERKKPVAGAGELVLRVTACGICGSDLHAAKTGFVPEGLVMGHEFCGQVEEVGAGVEGWEPGDRALGIPGWACGECENCQQGKIDQCLDLKPVGLESPLDGAYAEYVRVQAAFAVQIPEHLEDEVAVLYEPLSTALGAFRRGNVEVGDNILIIGGGAIGLSLAILARNFGVNLVGLSEMQPERIKRAGECGANVVINGAEEKDPVAAFRQMTGKEPSVIFECVGLPGMFQRVIDMAPPRSTVVAVGTCMEEESFTVIEAAQKYLTVQFHFGYEQSDIEYVVGAMALGNFDPSPLLSSKTTLEELPATFARLMEPNAECKVVVCPSTRTPSSSTPQRCAASIFRRR
jgi:(R,R)-butanediol dehydrogenase / meso-butanediol dehydrogenase / diacetyl reductase